MKGISDVIAMLLMLVVTIGLVGLAYSYISGVFTARTAVVLNIVPEASSCTPTSITVAVRNDGISPSGAVTLRITAPDGSDACTNTNNLVINSIPPGSVAQPPQACSRATGKGAGYYRIVATTAGSTAQGMVYCAS
jgi:FlaG/FlaF family flagellin (archaellin)